MNRRTNSMLVGLTLVGALSTSAVWSRDSQTHHFDFPRGAELYIDVEQGHIEVRTGSSNEVTVTVTVNRGTVDETMNLEFNDRNGLEILATDMPASGRNIEIGFEIEAPTDMDLRIETGGGHVQVDDVNGMVTIGSGGGHMELRDVGGDAEIRTGGGHIEIGHVEGGLIVKTGGGHISVDEVGSDLLVKTGGGHIEVGDVGGEVEAKTAGGHISLGRVMGPIDLDSSGGHIEVDGSAGDARIQTAGGGVTLRAMEGYVEASTNVGDMEVELAHGNSQGCDLDTDDGDIELRVPATEGYQIEARAHGGTVKTRMAVQGQASNGRLEGTIGSGGALVKLRTGDGDIFISESR